MAFRQIGARNARRRDSRPGRMIFQILLQCLAIERARFARSERLESCESVATVGQKVVHRGA